MKNKLEVLGILAGAVAVGYFVLKALKTGNAMQGLAGSPMLNTDGNVYIKTKQADVIASDLGFLLV